MRWMRFFQRARRDADLAHELEAHVAEETARQIADGVGAIEARAAAARQLGSTIRIREQIYERNSLPAVETASRDLSYAWRVLRRNPAFTAVAVLSIALGVGANAAVFTLLDQVLLRSLPVSHPEQLALLTAGGYQYGNAVGEGTELSYPLYQDIRAHAREFAAMFCRFATEVDVMRGGASEPVQAELVSGTYFDVLGVGAGLGRVLGRSDDTTPHGHPVIVLSHRYWRDRLASDRGILGRALRVNGQLLTVVGVAREGFNGTNIVAATDVFVPIMMAGEVTTIAGAGRDAAVSMFDDRRLRWLNVFARLAPGMTIETARARLQPFYASRLAYEVGTTGFARASDSDKARFLRGTLDLTPAAYGKSEARAQLTVPLLALTAIGIVVLIVACANVANLLLARATARFREISVRLALGATRARLIRQLFAESALLAVMGGAAGVAVAAWGAQGLVAFLVERDGALTISPWPDGRILAATLIVTLASAVLFGLVPAWQGARQDVGPGLKADSSRIAGGRHARLRRGLVIAQVMLSLLLLVAAGLFVRSLDNLRAIDPGFDTEQLLSFSLGPGRHGYAPERTKAFATAVLERVRATDGVAGAGFVAIPLLTGGTWNNRMAIAGRAYDPQAPVRAQINLVSPGYFAAMGIALRAGRDFDERDAQQVAPGVEAAPPRVAIANEQFVKEYLGGRDPIGVHVGFGRDPGAATPTAIVGVVANAKYASLRSPDTAQLFFPHYEYASIGGFTMYVRTQGSTDALLERIRAAIAAIDPAVPLNDVRTLDAQIDRSLVMDRMVARLSSILAVLATLLAMIGLYGVVSYSVMRRTREIAIRVAFGAAATRVVGLVVKDMLALVVTGVLLALPVVWLLGRGLRVLLYGVSASDPLALLIAVAMLLLSATAAIALPSWRALRVPPVTALRVE